MEGCPPSLVFCFPTPPQQFLNRSDIKPPKKIQRECFRGGVGEVWMGAPTPTPGAASQSPRAGGV